MNIRDACVENAESFASIYNHFVLTTSISFEEPSRARIEMAPPHRRRPGRRPAVAGRRTGGAVRGYAYATKWRVRDAYRFSVETTVYLAQDSGGQGIGTALYRALLDRLRAGGYHLAIGGIALPNPASIALHQKLGFEGGAVSGSRVQSVGSLDRRRVLAAEAGKVSSRRRETGSGPQDLTPSTAPRMWIECCESLLD